jgi:hypothetical protein
MAPMAISHHLKMLSSISPANDPPLVLKNMPVLFFSMKNYSSSKSLFSDAINEISEDDADAIYEIAEDDTEELFHSKNICTNHDYRIGEYFFVRQLKLIWQSQKINAKKISLRKRRINFQAHF